MAASRAYRELIRLQELAKLRHEMRLADLRAQTAAIEVEDADLFKMHDRRYEADAIVPNDIIMKRLETNKARRARLEETAMAERYGWLKVSRTIETLHRKLRGLEVALTRADAAAELDESISHLLVNKRLDSSLP